MTKPKQSPWQRLLSAVLWLNVAFLIALSVSGMLDAHIAYSLIFLIAASVVVSRI
jgi:hypothetical protein